MPKMSQAEPEKKIIFAGAGGAGKSTLMMLMASTALYNQKSIIIFEGDPANPTGVRYFKSMPRQNRLEDDRPEGLLRFLEDGVFGTDTPAMVDLGANMEGAFLRWLSGRGAIVAPSIRFIVPISKRDGIKAASRIALNCGAAQVLLVLNESGPDYAATAADPIFEDLAAQVGRLVRLPHLGTTMQDVHSKSMPPHIMAKSERRFEAQGALTMIRTMEEIFLDYPDFRPW